MTSRHDVKRRQKEALKNMGCCLSGSLLCQNKEKAKGAKDDNEFATSRGAAKPEMKKECHDADVSTRNAKGV
jgi:hypothetical protein